MNLTKLSTEQVLARMNALSTLHTGCGSKTFWICEAPTPNDTAILPIADDRFNDLLWDLYTEAFDEMHRRFSKPLDEFLKSLGNE